MLPFQIFNENLRKIYVISGGSAAGTNVSGGAGAAAPAALAAQCINIIYTLC